MQNNLLPCIVDGNIIFTQNQADSDEVSRNSDVANDAPEIYKLCMALCQTSLDDVNYSTIRTDASTDEEKETLWTNFGTDWLKAWITVILQPTMYIATQAVFL